MINVLSPKIKLSYNIVKGSVQTRKIKAQDFTSDIYDSFLECLKSNKSVLKFETVKSKISKKAPGINIKVLKNNISNNDAIMDVYADKEGKVYGYLLAFKSPKNILKVPFMPILMHEITHLSDYLFQPKLLSREQKILKIPDKTNRYVKFYEKYMYDEFLFNQNDAKDKYLANVKVALDKFISGTDKTYIIDYLQDIRYSLKTEMNAYEMQKKFAYKLKDSGFKINPSDLLERVKYFMFEDKIKLVEKSLSDLIKDQRIKNSKRIINT